MARHRPFVSSIEEVVANVASLDRSASADGPGSRAEELLRHGNNYVALRSSGGWLFAPSRFAGYRNNDLRSHEADGNKHGSRTDTALSRVLGSAPAPSGTHDRRLSAYLQLRGLNPAGNKHRRYWEISSKTATHIREDVAVDLKKISADKSIHPTTRKRLLDARLGQGRFRSDLILKFGPRCAISGCSIQEVLRASHIKPWRHSSNDERLDPNNGLLLAATLDALFDRYLISVDDASSVLSSAVLDDLALEELGLVNAKLETALDANQRDFMLHHRKEFLRRERDRVSRKKRKVPTKRQGRTGHAG